MPSRAQPRLQTGRYAAETSFHELFDGLRAVALAAASGDIDAAKVVSTRRWDAQRRTSGGGQLPSSAAVRKRFGLSWDVLLSVAFAEPARRAYLIGVRQSPPLAGRYAPEECVQALQAVARRVQRSPSALEYDHVAARIEDERQRLRHATSFLELPRSGIVKEAFGSWDDALAVAGLRRFTPLPQEGSRGPSWEEVLDRFIDATGVLPTRNYLRKWTEHNDISLGRPRRPWAEVVDEVRQRRAERGAVTPDEPASLKDPSLFPRIEQLPRRRTQAPLSRDDALASLRLYAERYLRPGQAPRLRHYKNVASGNPELISLGRYGKFQDLCREAGI